MPADLLREKFACFGGFDDAEMGNILTFCDRVKVPAGTALWVEGYGENYAGFLLEGKIGIKKQTEFGGKHVVIGVYTAGSVIGELCLLTDKPRAVAADVLESVDMVVLHSHKFEEMIEQHPLLGLRLLRHIFLSTSKRLTKSYERIASMF
ncbi:MAG: cyclic nucleotide-binding domain-containing protein [Desulfuromonadales bacterium]